MHTCLLRILIKAFCSIGIVLMTVMAHAASFDCAKARTHIEKLVCQDPTLSKLDDRLQTVYQWASSKLGPGDLRGEQRDWLKTQRDVCKDKVCLKHRYEDRIQMLLQIGHDVNDDSNIPRYHFTLTRGKGTAVCGAYLMRLNVTTFTTPPFCGRPENVDIPGFQYLQRVPLNATDVRELYPIIWDFVQTANDKARDWHNVKWQEQLVQTGQAKLSPAGVKQLQSDLDRGFAEIWTFKQPIDIDNDGQPDQVQIWEGSALPFGVGGRVCGQLDYHFDPNGEQIRQPQYAFIIKGKPQRLDVSRTEAIFGSPLHAYRIYDQAEKKWGHSGRYRPIGMAISIFEFNKKYYFDTFFDSWGDFAGKRRKDSHIGETLGVFLHKDGKTRQVCEYQMTHSNN